MVRVLKRFRIVCPRRTGQGEDPWMARLRRAQRRRRLMPVIVAGLFIAGVGVGFLLPPAVVERPAEHDRETFELRLPQIIAPPAYHGAPGALRGLATVHDADTLLLAGRSIRLQGIDAPELDQACLRSGKPWPCGREAARAVAAKVRSRIVVCEAHGFDRYGRVLAECFVDGESLNAWVVRQGWAIAYRRYSMAYVSDETVARREERGIWSGSFDPPEHWRQGR